MPLSKEQITTIRKQEYEPFRQKLDVVENIITADHESWWFRTMLFLRRLQRSLEQHPEEYTEGIHQYATQLVAQIIAELATEVDKEGDSVLRGHEAILRISEGVPVGQQIEIPRVRVRSMSLSTLAQKSDKVSIITMETKTGERRGLRILDSEGQPHDFPLPEIDGIYHKGGISRVIVKLIADVDSALLDAELPPNDFDIIADSALPTHLVETEAAAMQVDPDGIEYVSSLNFERLFVERDLNINMVFVGADTVYFAEEAIEAARTGLLQVMSAHRGIYGTEVFVYDDQVLLKNRGLMRLFKTVAEGKATHFEFTKLNENISFGIYWLVLFRKFAAKDNAALYLDRLFELAKQTNMLPEGTSNIIEVLDASHAKYPFFDFDASGLDKVGVVRWLGNKLLRQVDASYRHNNRIPNELVIDRTKGDDVPYRVDLDNYVADPQKLAWISSEIPRFYERSRQRTRAYKEASNDAVFDED